MGITDFHADLAWSDSPDVVRDVKAAILKEFPECLNVIKAGISNDRLGADYILEFPHCQFRTIDLKARRQDWSIMRERDDRIAVVEIWSNLGKCKAVWSVDREKITDFILYFYADTKRAHFYPAMQLRQAVTANIDYLRKISKTMPGQQTGNYQSDAFLVSHRTLWNAMYAHANGQSLQLWMTAHIHAVNSQKAA